MCLTWNVTCICSGGITRGGVCLLYNHNHLNEPTVQLVRTVESKPIRRERARLSARPIADASIIDYPNARSRERRGVRKSPNRIRNAALKELQQQKWQYWLLLQKARERRRKARQMWLTILVVSISSPFFLVFVKQNKPEIKRTIEQRIQVLKNKLN